ncbi:hypothetical protein [Anaerovibrio sp. RM50]|uniref:hypothetical protein n=1 Tax=Anaerovibrio sp. RM50 TaxID=1200557 RepID=UPI000481034F|nr:hypothetical protein [Anaerovibrio sp. RM50]
MKRPEINLDKHNLLYYICVGGGWLLVGLLDIISNDNIILLSISACINALMIMVLLYVLIGKRETGDEMTIKYHERAMSEGFYFITCLCLILLCVDNIFKLNVSFQVYGHLMLGVGFLVTGFKFHQLEKDGE